MKPSVFRVGLLIAACCAALCAQTAMASAEQTDPSLAGAWRLDEERSDDARDALQDALRTLAADLRPPSRNRSRSSPIQRRAPRAALGRDVFGPLRLPETRIALDLSETDVAFTLDGGAPERIWTDGRPSVVDAENPGVRLGAWEDRVLWIERNSDRGTRIIEAWRRQGADLIADFEVRNALLEEPIEFTLVFVDADADADANADAGPETRGRADTDRNAGTGDASP